MKSGVTMSRLGERIKKARELNNLSQTELAALIQYLIALYYSYIPIFLYS